MISAITNDHVLICTAGTWGVAESDAAALAIVAGISGHRKDAQALRAECPKGTRVDDMGRIYTPAGTALGPLIHGRITGTRNRPGFKANATQPD